MFSLNTGNDLLSCQHYCTGNRPLPQATQSNIARNAAVTGEEVPLRTLRKGKGCLCVDGEAGLCYNKISKNLGRSIPAGWSVMG